MGLSLPPLAGVLLAILMAATLSTADSLDVRAPQEDTDEDYSSSLHFYTPVASSTIPSWYSTTAASSQPTESVAFAFGSISDMTVCGESNITWSYTGDTFYMMGIAAMPVEDESASSSDSSTVIAFLNGGLAIGYYTWSPVNVPAGEYVIEVSIPNVNTLYFSEPFYIVEGLDTSCLAGTSSSVSSSGTSATPGSSSSVSSSSAGDASGAPAIGAVNDGSSLSSGGIAGVVIGVVIFVGALIAALFLLRRCRANRPVGAPRGGLFEKRRPKGAISIGSRGGSISSFRGVPARGAGSAFVRGGHYSLNDPSRSDAGHGVSEEDVRSPSISGEKRIGHAPVEFGMFPPAVVHRSAHAYRDSFGSAVSGSTTAAGSPIVTTSHYKPTRQWSFPQAASDPFASGLSTPSPRASGDYHGPPDTQVPVALFSPSSAASTPRTYGSPGIPRDISIASSSSPDLTCEPEIASSFGPTAAPTVQRRAFPAQAAVPISAHQSRSRGKSASSRKPVPVYVPSTGEALELVETPTPRSATSAVGSYYNDIAGQHSRASLGQTSSTGNDWSSAAAHSHSPPSGGSHGSFLSETSRRSLTGLAGRGDIPELNHKSSFGDRQMHVIMPDPPSHHMQ